MELDIDKLSKQIAGCKKCNLCKTRNNVVVGDGNIHSKIMLIGEAPGEQEDLTGNAFVGKAGQLLDKMLASIGLDRNNVYICNVVKCRPPENRNPLPDEQKVCMEYLREQFRIMKPQIVVLLGSVASKAILSPNFSITRQHGRKYERKGIEFLPTFHPSALLRNPSKKRLAWEDLKHLKYLIYENEIEIL